jgi:alkylation response protein AidB-like acyl-CoA dehydrogenase
MDSRNPGLIGSWGSSSAFDSPAEAAFRSDVAKWLDAHLPTGSRWLKADPMAGRNEAENAEYVAESVAWQRIKYEHGWAGLTWPMEQGGRALAPSFAAIFQEEENLRVAHTATFTVGVGMVGPILLAHGTSEQRRRFLGPILRGDEIWCQLFSEPSAGSDLSALQTTALRDGDTYIVNGQKVWSSGAHYADLGILLARTDVDEPAHRAISCFVLDMRTPGVEVRPLRQLTGGSEFNEVFFDDVRVDASRLVGAEGEGWRAALATLSHERSTMGARRLKVTMEDLFMLAERHGRRRDPIARQRLADAYVHISVIRYLALRESASASASPNDSPGPASSVLKLATAGLNTRLANLAAELQGAAAMLGAANASDDSRFLSALLSQGVYRIAGGTDEIQRNLIGRNVLDLPSEPRQVARA